MSTPPPSQPPARTTSCAPSCTVVTDAGPAPLELLWLQLANEETTLRMQRYLRQPLFALAGIVGTRGVATKRTVLDRSATRC